MEKPLKWKALVDVEDLDPERLQLGEQVIEILGGSKPGGHEQSQRIRQAMGPEGPLRRLLAASTEARPPETLEETPEAQLVRDEWVDGLRSWVESCRTRAFGSTAPPFSDDDWTCACEWIEAESARTRDREPAAAEFMRSEEYEELKARGRDAARMLRERTGYPFVFGLASVTPGMTTEGSSDPAQSPTMAPIPSNLVVTYATPDSGRNSTPEGQRSDGTDSKAVEVTTVRVPRDSNALGTLATAVGDIADLTGFEPHEVTRWILTGAKPSVRRVSVRAEFVSRLDPSSGRLVHAPRVRVDLYSAEVRHEDLRTLHPAISQAWEDLRDCDPDRSGARERMRSRAEAGSVGRLLDIERGTPRRQRASSRSRITREDLALLRAIRSMGGAPFRGSTHTWEDVRARCQADDGDDIRRKKGRGPATAESLRKRWARLQPKLEAKTPTTGFEKFTDSEPVDSA